MAPRIARTWLGGAAACALGLTGCAGTYDLVTSQRFKDRPFHTLFSSDDPVVVLETVQEGDDRVRAMRDLKEPKESGRPAAEQDKVVEILRVSATTDRRAFCRLEAIQTLSRFKDPRVGPILVAAYHNAAYDAPPAAPPGGEVSPAAVNGLAIRGAVSSFTPDSVTTIQARVLESLGRVRSPEGLRLLVEVAAAPTERPKPTGVEPAGALTLEGAVGASEPDRVDVRLAAIRALGSYENDPTAARTLVAVLKVDKDVAVRGRAHESLVKITGQDLPPDGQAWANWLERGGKGR